MWNQELSLWNKRVKAVKAGMGQSPREGLRSGDVVQEGVRVRGPALNTSRVKATCESELALTG